MREIRLEDLPVAGPYTSPTPVTTYGSLDGDKFFGGFGDTVLYDTDYVTLRQRSEQLFKENLYASGLVERLVTNEINTGLNLEAWPEESILNMDLSDWADEVENRFYLWGSDRRLCDYKKEVTFSNLQRMVRRESIISGDILVVLYADESTGLPSVRLVPACRVCNPLGAVDANIVHGVELDPKGRQIAYYVMNDDMSSVRIPAYGGNSGRRIAWLYYGSPKRTDSVRGTPLLSLVLQSLKEIDRYRDSAQRKAVVNSVLAMFIKNSKGKMGTLPITGGAVRKGTASITDYDGSTRSFNITKHIPGMILEQLQDGEEPVGFHSQGTDLNFPEFEQAILNAIAWSFQIPATILKLAFSANYSASQGEINEFKMYLNIARELHAEQFCQPVYCDWLVSEVLNGKIKAPGFIESLTDPRKYDIYGSWVSTKWTGVIKQSTDLFKQARAYEMLIKEGLITRHQAVRELGYGKFIKVAEELKKENNILGVQDAENRNRTNGKLPDNSD